jgi:hypothetical protein
MLGAMEQAGLKKEDCHVWSCFICFSWLEEGLQRRRNSLLPEFMTTQRDYGVEFALNQYPRFSSAEDCQVRVHVEPLEVGLIQDQKPFPGRVVLPQEIANQGPSDGLKVCLRNYF